MARSAKFVAVKAVPRIEWDFTGVPHVGAQDDDRVPKTVQGEHVVDVLPEPDPDTLARFLQAQDDLIAEALQARRDVIERFTGERDEDEDDLDPQEVSAAALSTREVYLSQHEQIVAALRIVDVPNELLEQLPPRYVAALMNHIGGQLQGEDDAA